MSKEKKLIPSLRFSEFKNEGEWVKNKLDYYLELLTDFEANGSFADVKNNVTIYAEINYAWYVRATDLENNSPIEKVKFVDQKSYYFLKKTSLSGGELLITKRGEIGKIYYFNPGKRLLATVAPNLYLLKFNKHAVPKFFYFHFITPDGNNSLKRLNASSTIGALYKDDVKNIQILSPSIKEQQKIASCLSSLDEVIAAHGQKLELLKDHKKGLMQILFPQEDEKVPKYRFPEFDKDGEWIEKTIGQVSKITTGSKDTQNKVDNGKYPFFVRSQTVERINSYSFDGEAILTSGDGVGVGKNFHYINGKFDFHQRVYCIYDFAEEVSGQFVYIYFSQHFYERVMRMSAKNSVDSIRMAMITEMPINLPSEREQRRITDCFSYLNELITAQAEKIEQLKLHKKGLMQGLFPKND